MNTTGRSRRSIGTALNSCKESRGDILGLILLLSLLCPPVPASADLPTHARAVAAIDGDTLLLEGGRKVRYLGINAPDRGDPFFDAATGYNDRLIRGREVRLEFDAVPEDRYGRLLAYVYVEETLINLKLLQEGLAHLFILPPNTRFYDLFFAAQEEARAGRKGLWGPRGIPGPLKITHIEVPTRREKQDCCPEEYIRVANISPAPVELQGYTLTTKGGLRYTFPSLAMRPGYVLTLHSGTGLDHPLGDAPLLYWGQKRPVWNSRGDEAQLWDPAGRLVDRVTYRSGRLDRERRKP